MHETNWVAFWLECSWLTYPTTEDKEMVTNLNTWEIPDYYVVISQSLKQFVDANMEDSEQCRKLHEYYKLLKTEFNCRETNVLPQKDAFLDYIEHKQDYQKQENLMEDARKYGNICPYCESENVRSYNQQEWKCYSCGKRFRKH